MKRILILTAIMLIALVGVKAQSLETVLDKHYAATGYEKMAKVKTFDIKAQMGMMGMSMPMNIKIKKPNKFRVDMEVMGQKTISAFDGTKGWMINPMIGAGVKDLEGAELDKAMEQADMEGELYNYAKKGHAAELIGKVDADGKQAWQIKLTAKDGSVKNYFINADTYLIDKVTAKVDAMGQTMEIETKMVEYQTINGIKMTKKIEAVMPMGTVTTTMDEIKLDENLDDSIFERPAN
uniref:LolA family protein n=1 Tax=uncultured Draconibacterium sp. TaxID=1573823 RepID=UPI0032177EE0